MRVEVAVLGSPVLMSLMVSVDVKQFVPNMSNRHPRTLSSASSSSSSSLSSLSDRLAQAAVPSDPGVSSLCRQGASRIEAASN